VTPSSQLPAPSSQLRDGVLFVAGASQGALLDTTSGAVYSLNPEACAVLRYEVEDDPYWETLVSMGLAERTLDVRRHDLPRNADADRLTYLWLEVVTDDCNERCVHCRCRAVVPVTRRRCRAVVPVTRERCRARVPVARGRRC